MKTTENIRRVLIALFVGFLCLPLAVSHLPIPPGEPLRGLVQWESELPLTFSQWADRSYQKYFESPRTRFFGTLSLFVAWGRTLGFHLFGELPGMMIGKDSHLYLLEYPQALRVTRRNPSWIETNAVKLGIARRILAKRGTELLFVIAPSKAEIYREELPKPLPKAIRDALQGPEPHALFTRALRHQGVDVLDAAELFRIWRKWSSEDPIFTLGGHHWSNYGSCVVAKQLISRLPAPYRAGGGGIDCVLGPKNQEAQPPDADLAWGSNLMAKDRYLRAGRRVQIVKRGVLSSRQGIAIIADSFGDGLIAGLDSAFPFAPLAKFYYYLGFSTRLSPLVDLTDLNPSERVDRILKYPLAIVLLDEVRIERESYLDRFLADVLSLEPKSSKLAQTK